MLTLEALAQAGANINEGVERCMGNEEFYLKLVKMAIEDDGYEKMEQAVKAGDLDTGFERAHALKGVLGNVSLDNLLAPVVEITEELRARKERDYTDLLETIRREHQKLLDLL